MKNKEIKKSLSTLTSIDHTHLILDDKILKMTNSNDLILEIGCGMGFDMLYLTNHNRNVIGLDSSISQLKLAQKTFQKENKKVHLIKGDIHNLPFKPESFDFIYSILVMQYFRNFNTLVEEQKRILKKGKWLAIYITYRYSFYTILKHFLMLIKKWSKRWETEYSMKEIHNLLKKEGFKIVTSWGSGLDIFLSLIIYLDKITRFGKIKNSKIIIMYQFIVTPFRSFIERNIGTIRKKFPTAAATSIVVIGSLETEHEFDS